LAGLCAAAAAVDIRIEEELNVEVAATTSSLTSTMCELSGTLPGVDAAVEGEHVELLQRSIDALGKVDLDSVDAAADDAAADAASFFADAALAAKSLDASFSLAVSFSSSETVFTIVLTQSPKSYKIEPGIIVSISIK
jgi:hypothetical protein